jgi:hypothetical protein
VISAGLDFNDHGHSQDTDGGGDAEQDTNTPKDVS